MTFEFVFSAKRSSKGHLNSSGSNELRKEKNYNFKKRRAGNNVIASLLNVLQLVSRSIKRSPKDESSVKLPPMLLRKLHFSRSGYAMS